MKRFLPLLALLLVTLLLFAGAGLLHAPLLRDRDTYGLNAAEPLENAPPVIAFTTVALGGFRGIVADLLWLRMAALQDQGRFVELLQLSNWITRLEPRFVDIWAFHAWNMAYNVSVMMPTPEQRWAWVTAGIGLLRDEAMLYNPRSPHLCHELSHMYLDKIGGPADSAAAFYKRALASEITERFGSAATNTTAIVTNDCIAAEARAAGLRPESMISLNDEYGPLDWRLAETHALYWAYRGKELAKTPSPALQRLMIHSLATLFKCGQLTCLPESDFFLTSPSFEMLPGTLKAYDEAILLGLDTEAAASYRRFLEASIRTLVLFAQTEDARLVFNRLHASFPAEYAADGFDAHATSIKEALR